MDREIRKIIDLEFFSKFLAVGIVGMLVDNALLFTLHNYMYIHVILAKVASAETSIAVMFLINDYWTFKQQNKRSKFRRFLRSNSVRFVGLAVGTAAFYIFYLMEIPLIMANIMGIGTGFVFNYFFETLLTWEKIDRDKILESISFKAEGKNLEVNPE
jgi:putative flippase GtrA